jgi:hypothetical protein
MSLAEYFQQTKGVGVLATSDASGKVDVAIYARPYVIDDNNVAFSMLERLTYANISANPHAAYLFIEDAEGYKGKRFSLAKTGEETDEKKILEIKKQYTRTYSSAAAMKHFVYFRIDEVRPLVGGIK